MPAPYDSPWQASTYSLHDTQYRPTQGPSAYLYPPPNADYSNERSNPSNPQPYDPPYPVAKPPQTMNGAALRGRTPSPTPSERKELNKGAIDWKAMSNWRFWIRKEWAWYYVALVIILVLTALMTLYHKQIVHWLTPVTKWLHDLPFGWVVPIAVLFVISFPPLFGHEIVAILCGLVWGLWIGFGIVAAGTFLVEVGNFYAFKYCCRSRGEKLERTNLSYACLAKVVRDGGFKIALIARLSAIPGHFTTAIFSTCGMGIIVFSIAAILSMPKQFITVYLGVILEQSADGTQDTKSRIISDVVLAITILITALAMWYILREMNKVKPDVIYAKRKARQAKLERQLEEQDLNGHAQDSSYSAFEHGYINSSESDIPLTSRAMPMGQAPSFPQPTHFQGHSSDSVNEPPLHAPRPHRVGVQVPHVGSDEELTSAEPMRTQFDPPYNSPRPSYGSYPVPTHGQPNPTQPFPSSNSEAPESLRPGRSRSTSAPGQRTPNFSRPTASTSPPVPHLPSSGERHQPSIAAPQPQHYSTSRNTFAPSLDHQQNSLNISQQPYHIPEESYGSYHTVQTASPEPITADDVLRSRTLQPSSESQGPQVTHATTFGAGNPIRGQDPSVHAQWDAPPPDYSFR